MVARFYLDQSQLDDADVGLDGPSPAFVLDTSQLDGDGKLDGTTFTTPATGAAPLGALAASATATVTHIVTGVAEAPLGELVAEVSEVTVTVDAEADATLGGLSASATANIDNPASGDAPLGGLTASANGTINVSASASATLGEIASSATGAISVVATAVGNLGSVIAVATGTVIPLGTMTANLGGLDATAIGTVIPQPTPPQPQTQGGGGRLHPYRQSRPKQAAPQPVVEPEIVVVPVKTVQAYCTPIVASVSASAQGRVTFVAEDDDLQVILML